MSKNLAKFISVLFHPIWFPVWVLILYLVSNPIAFGLSSAFEDKILLVQTFITCTFLPLVSIFVMWKVKLIPSIQMNHRMERIGPYIAVTIFMLWYYLNIDLYGVAPVFRLYILGGIISLFLLFFGNVFIKLSLHAMGMSGLLMNLVIARKVFDYRLIIVKVRDQYYQYTFEIIIVITLLILFIVLLSRFHLRKHTPVELAGGFILGILGQLFALRLINIL